MRNDDCMRFKCLFWLGIGVIQLPTLAAGELIWFPLHGSGHDTEVPVYEVGQRGSEVFLVAWLGVDFDESVNIPSSPLHLSVPSLFLVGALYQDEVEATLGGFDTRLYSDAENEAAPYDNTLGSGWIFHQRGRQGFEQPRVTESLGWLYIRHYPWVYRLHDGWLYVHEDGIVWQSNAWWFYRQDAGWIWTTRDLYPWIYRAESGWTEEG